MTSTPTTTSTVPPTAAPVATPVAAALPRQLLAEAAGTAVLVLAVIGTALFSAGFDDGRGGLGVGFLGVALALGLGVMVAAAAFGPISGGHFNPAVTLGLATAGRFPWRRVAPFVAAQVAGGLVGATLLAAVAAAGGGGRFAALHQAGFASTGWGTLSPGRFGLGAALLIEAITTCLFVGVVIAVSGQDALRSIAPVVIGLALTVVALIAIPVSNGSFNPARSVATAVWGGALPLAQLWMSVVAPCAGAVVAGLLARVLSPAPAAQR
jgi:aquaporin Z